MERVRADKGFDEQTKEAIGWLLETYWVLREKQPDIYQLIQERENVIRQFFTEKLGYRLIAHRHFYKLEKVPAEPEPWMGIQEFQEPRDYALFCCLLAFLETKNVDEQFLLSHITEEIPALYPEEDVIDWSHYPTRRSLIRVLKKAKDLGILTAIDGDEQSFGYVDSYQETEVLYEVTPVTRYFLRSYPRDLHQFVSTEALLVSEYLEEDEKMGLRRRHRVYRKLLLTPGIMSGGPDDTDFLYVRNYRNTLQQDFEQILDMRFELFKSTGALFASENKSRWTLYPEKKAIADIALLVSGYVRNLADSEKIRVEENGCVRMTVIDFEQIVHDCKVKYGQGWSKEYREAKVAETAQQLMDYLIDWGLAEKVSDSGQILLKPLYARTIGQYPKDFVGGNSVDSEGEEPRA